MSDRALLDVKALSCSFGGTRALDGVDVTVCPGQVVGVVGPNGSGKTTFFDCVTGWNRLDGGEVRFEGRSITGWAPHRIARLGVARTFQIGRVFPTISVVDNVVLGVFARRRTTDMDRREARARAADYLDRVGLLDRADDLAGQLSYGQRKLVEIGQAAAGRPKLMLLDEPTAGVNIAHRGVVADLLLDARADGRSVLVVEHEMSSFHRVLDDVIALDAGRVALAEPFAEQVPVSAAGVGR